MGLEAPLSLRAVTSEHNQGQFCLLTIQEGLTFARSSGISLSALSKDSVWAVKETIVVFLAGGHGEEVVRCVLNDHEVQQSEIPAQVPLAEKLAENSLQSGVIYSAGEDGCIKAWSMRGDAKFAVEVNALKRKGRREKEERSARYKPY